MFDIGFIELLLISVVALVVLGPERLPGAIRTLGLWIGRLRRSFNNIKADIEREVGADEIRRQLRNEAILDKIKNTRSRVEKEIDSVKEQAKSVTKDLDLEQQLPPSPDDENTADDDTGTGDDAALPTSETKNQEVPANTDAESDTPAKPDEPAKAAGQK